MTAALPAILLAALGVGMMILALFGCLAHLASGQRHRWDWGPATSSQWPALCPRCNKPASGHTRPYCIDCVVSPKPASSQLHADDQPALCPNCKQKPCLDSWPYCETCLLNDESLWEDSWPSASSQPQDQGEGT